MVFKGPGEILPRTVDSFSISSTPRYFGPDNLYDLINGGAEIYVELGLKEMATCDFKSDSHPNVTITLEIYDQGTPIGAFGRMTRFLSEKIDPSKAGEGLPETLKDRGLLGSTDLIFFKDRYLVHITLIDESADATAESMSEKGRSILPRFAQSVSSKIPADSPLPAELALFPREHGIARSEAWVPKNLAGAQDAGSGFSFRYRDGNAGWALFLTDEIKDQDSIDATVKRLADNAADKKLFAFERAGNRIIGFAADADSWTDKNRKTAMDQLAALRKAIMEKP